MLHWFAKRLREVQEKDQKGEKGFTLIELLVVVIIIGILAAIAIPVFLAQRERSLIAECRSDTRNAAAAATAYASDQPDGTYTGATMTVLADDYGFNQSENTTTTITGTPGDNIQFSSACDPGGNATYNSDDGVVTGP